MNPSTSGPVVLATFLLSGCGHTPPQTLSWRIEPVLRTTHAPAAERYGDAAQAAGHVALARQMEGQGRASDALRFWHLAAAQAPHDPQILHRFGVALAQQGHRGDALAMLRRADALAPDDPVLLNNLGYVLMLDGQAEPARRLFDRALQLNPMHRHARQNLAKLDPRPEAIASVVHTPTPASTPKTTVPAAETETPSVRGALAGLRTEVINGNGQNGAAKRLTRWLKTHGAMGSRTANKRPFNTTRTVVQYVPGHREQAMELARQLPVAVKLSEIPDITTGIEIRVVLGHDLRKASLAASVSPARKGMAHMPGPFAKGG